MKYRTQHIKTILSALFLALAYTLPFLTGQIPEIGSMLCPMHIPVLLCGYLCGWPWGFFVGLAAPLFRSLTLGMPILFPKALCMAIELAAYGALSGILHHVLPKKKAFIYLSLIIAMIGGRLLYGISMFFCLGGNYGFSVFLSGTVLEAIPGILLQIVLIPLIVIICEHSAFFKKLKK